MFVFFFKYLIIDLLLLLVKIKNDCENIYINIIFGIMNIINFIIIIIIIKMYNFIVLRIILNFENILVNFGFLFLFV